MKNLLAVGLIALFAVQGVADDKPKGKKKGQGNSPMIEQIKKQLAGITLDDAQTAKLTAAGETFMVTMKELRANGLTPELSKKKAEATKAARAEGVKQKDLLAKVMEGMTTEEAAVLTKAEEALKTMKASVAAMLTPEQVEALSEQAKRQLGLLKPGKGKGKGKKNDA